MHEHLKTATHGQIQHITFNRPDRKNALTNDMYERSAEALTKVANDHSVRVVVIRGAGDCFTAGNDLKDFRDNPPQSASAPVYRFLEALIACRKPVVAGVAGVAVGIGTTMLLHCDIVVASEDARFSLPFAKLGLCPEAASSYLLPLIAGRATAMDLLLLGNAFGAEEAHRIGLVGTVCKAGSAVDIAVQKAEEIAALPPSSVRLTKQLVRDATADLVTQTMQREAHHFLQRLVSPEAAEAFQAFAEKRPPDFSAFK